MASIKIKDDIYFVGSMDWDRKLFDELIPLPEGTSYNSYLIKGSEKIALIDSVDPAKKEELFNNLAKINVTKIDYLIANHAEQDHSGSLPYLLEKFPMAKVVTNTKCKDFLKDLLLISDDKFQVVNECETISLGNKTLEFYMTPWVHWPETMVTYLKEDKILFSCDFFGAHLASSDIFVSNECEIYSSAKRYFAEIMMPFRVQIRKNVEKVEKLNIEMIAPSHGQIHKNPKFIIECYKDWISDNVKKEVVIPFVSMHESTQKMVDYLIDGLMEKGFTVKPFNLPKTDIGELAMSLVDTSTVVIGSPMVLAGPHPAAVYATYLFNLLRPKTKFVGIIGSFGWGGKMIDSLKEMLTNVKVELFEPVFIKGHPKKEDFALLDKLIEEIDKKHKENNIV
ncbi:MAG: MBL fold hydrolase [Spirochaetes bacterium GWD1_27_9]|nr:MAG: MBL fold hydrolase [Spirochaetes bacterium GWB1_27_13]OHD26726.1 MAG: MBL fold hydrolase [Spirochaetes bacterium GWC1_27_15]OHD44680.1 MAG: MBL fold hydrolase [Spirochaetes bacterium GWD1_27_9]